MLHGSTIQKKTKAFVFIAVLFLATLLTSCKTSPTPPLAEPPKVSEPSQEGSVEKAPALRRVFPANYKTLPYEEQVKIVEDTIAALEASSQESLWKIYKQLSGAGRAARAPLLKASESWEPYVRLFGTLALLDIDEDVKKEFVSEVMALNETYNSAIAARQVERIGYYGRLSKAALPIIIRSMQKAGVVGNDAVKFFRTIARTGEPCPQAVPFIYPYLDNSVAELRLAAAATLSVVGTDCGKCQQVVLEELTAEKKKDVLAAIETIRRFKPACTAAFRKPLLKFLTNEKDYWEVYSKFDKSLKHDDYYPIGVAAAQTLAQIGIPGKTSTRSLISLLKAKNTGLKLYALYSLREIGSIDDAALLEITESLRDRNMFVHIAAANTLATASTSDRIYNRILPKLSNCIYNGRYQQQNACVRALGNFENDSLDKLDTLIDAAGLDNQDLAISATIALVKSLQRNRDARKYFIGRAERIGEQNQAIAFLILLAFETPDLYGILKRLERKYNELIGQYRNMQPEWSRYFLGDYKGEVAVKDQASKPVEIHIFHLNGKIYGSFKIEAFGDQMYGALFDFRSADSSMMTFNFFDSMGNSGRVVIKLNYEDNRFTGKIANFGGFEDALWSGEHLKEPIVK